MAMSDQRISHHLSALQTRIAGHATLENALKWQSLTDQYIFCQNLLDMSFAVDGEDDCDWAVMRLEAEFDKLLAAQ